MWVSTIFKISFLDTLSRIFEIKNSFITSNFCVYTSLSSLLASEMQVVTDVPANIANYTRVYTCPAIGCSQPADASCLVIFAA